MEWRVWVREQIAISFQGTGLEKTVCDRWLDGRQEGLLKKPISTLQWMWDWGSAKVVQKERKKKRQDMKEKLNEGRMKEK